MQEKNIQTFINTLRIKITLICQKKREYLHEKKTTKYSRYKIYPYRTVLNLVPLTECKDVEYTILSISGKSTFRV